MISSASASQRTCCQLLTFFLGSGSGGERKIAKKLGDPLFFPHLVSREPTVQGFSSLNDGEGWRVSDLHTAKSSHNHATKAWVVRKVHSVLMHCFGQEKRIEQDG